MKNAGKILREEREKWGFTQHKLAKLSGVSRSAISRYELGENIPMENLILLSKTLKSAKLRIAAVGTPVRIEYLDLVDEHPLALQLKLIEELTEALESVQNLDLVNKLKESDLNKEEKEILMKSSEEVYDIIICAAMFLANYSQQFNIDLEELEDIEMTKLKSKNYMSTG